MTSHHERASLRGAAVYALAALGLAGCATPTAQLPDVTSSEVAAEMRRQEELRFMRRLDDHARLFRVASRVNAANVEFCKDTIPSIGLYAIHSGELTDLERSALAKWAGDGPYKPDAVIVAAVAPGSTAEAAGLRRGDTLSDVGGASLSAAESSDASPEVIGLEPDARTVIRATHKGAPTTAALTPTRSCAYRLRLLDSEEINAYADGEAIYVSRGMMRFARTDEELAVVYGHELAHNVMGHVEAKRANATVGVVAGAAIDILFAVGGVDTGGGFTRAAGEIGAQAYSQEFEKEADYVGLYYTHRAGFDTSRAPEIWRRMGADGDGSAIKAASTHPTTTERYLLLDRTLAEIQAKAAARVALTPNIEEAPVRVATESQRERRAALRGE